MRRVFGLIVLTAGVHACASSSTYIPEERATAILGGRTAASYAFSSKPGQQGNIRLASRGLAKLKRRGGVSREAIHVSMAIAGEGKELVLLDTRAQRLQLPDGRQLAPVYATSKVSSVPVMRVDPGRAKTVDLYFELPEDLRDAARPPGFGVVWRLRVGDKMVSAITPFDEVAVDPALARKQRRETVEYWREHPEPIVDPNWGGSTDVGAPAF